MYKRGKILKRSYISSASSLTTSQPIPFNILIIIIVIIIILILIIITTILIIRVGNCAFLVANATKNFALATRISQLVASRRLTISGHDNYTNKNFDSTRLPPFSLIRDFGKQNTRGNLSKISVSLPCYRQIESKSTNHSH